MAKSNLGGFYDRVNKVSYQHVIDLDTDATHLLDGDEKFIYTVDSNARVSDSSGLVIGWFHLDSNDMWYYKAGNGIITETGNKDLIKAEKKIFKQLLGVE